MSEVTPKPPPSIGSHVWLTEPGPESPSVHSALVTRVETEHCPPNAPPPLDLLFITQDNLYDYTANQRMGVPHSSTTTEPPFWNEA